MLQNIDHINIVVEDLERVARFFLSFGFQERDRSRLQGDWISKTVGLEKVEAEYVKLTLPGDRTSLELIRFDHPPALKVPHADKPNASGLRHLAFRVTDIESAVALLNAQGIVPLSGIQEYAPARKKLVYFSGPEGILLELAQYDGAAT